MEKMFIMSSLNGLPIFFAYFVSGLILFVLFLFIYSRVTPYKEFHLIKKGNMAAASSLAGAMLGFVIPLANAIAESVSLVDMVIWGAIALAVQLLAFIAVRFIVPRVAKDIAEGKVASGLFLGSLSLSLGILNAACITY